MHTVCSHKAMDTVVRIMQGVNPANVYCESALRKAKHGITAQHAVNRKAFFQGDGLKVKNQVWDGKKGRHRHLQNRKSVCVCVEPKETRLPLVTLAAPE